MKRNNYLGSTINAANAELNPYGTLMNQGYNAANAQGQLGMNAANTQAGYITGANNAVAQGMIAKDQALQNSGNQWIQLGSMAAGAAMGGAGGAQMAGQLTQGIGAPAGQQSYGQLGGQQPQYQYQQPQVMQDMSSGFTQGWNNATGMPQIGQNMPQGAMQPAQPWRNPDQGNNSSWQAR